MGRQWMEVWINALHQPPPIGGSDADVAISNPLQFQCTDSLADENADTNTDINADTITDTNIYTNTDSPFEGKIEDV